MKPWVVDGIALVIAFGWIVSVIADIVVEGYSPSPFMYMTMAGLASAIFGKRFVDGFKNITDYVEQSVPTKTRRKLENPETRNDREA